MRGKHNDAKRELVEVRLIPAHAGKTRDLIETPEGTAAHPRACGENVDEALQEHQAGGSSPRMRGKPARLTGLSPNTGLIPAHAGKTPTG